MARAGTYNWSQLARVTYCVAHIDQKINGAEAPSLLALEVLEAVVSVTKW